jgi:hypothetical protein
VPSNPTRERGQRRAFALTHSFTTVSERAADIALSGSYRLTKSARARSHAARSGVHAEARRWSTSPPHHLTTSPHDGERNTRTRQRRAAMNSISTEAFSLSIIWLVMSTASYCGSKASFTSQIPRCTLRCPHGSTSLVPGSSSYRVCEFVLVTDHNSLS